MREREVRIHIDLNAAEPVYRQIAAQLRALIMESALKPGDPLPPVRRLALDLAVHFNTVAEAYRTLAEEGWLDVGHGRTALVRSRVAPTPTEETVEALTSGLRRALAEAKAGGVPARRIRKELRTFLEALES
jgi:GntR family transcriptional regulator